MRSKTLLCSLITAFLAGEVSPVLAEPTTRVEVGESYIKTYVGDKKRQKVYFWYGTCGHKFPLRETYLEGYHEVVYYPIVFITAKQPALSSSIENKISEFVKMGNSEGTVEGYKIILFESPSTIGMSVTSTFFVLNNPLFEYRVVRNESAPEPDVRQKCKNKVGDRMCAYRVGTSFGFSDDGEQIEAGMRSWSFGSGAVYDHSFSTYGEMSKREVLKLNESGVVVNELGEIHTKTERSIILGETDYGVNHDTFRLMEEQYGHHFWLTLEDFSGIDPEIWFYAQKAWQTKTIETVIAGAIAAAPPTACAIKIPLRTTTSADQYNQTLWVGKAEYSSCSISGGLSQ
ncbi:hypothetical protein HZC30_01695 [Candidatus Woesearchaeota archaeon]|nr:hypothetical protein [Candidatus Woesearchaeota archaeon]